MDLLSTREAMSMSARSRGRPGRRSIPTPRGPTTSARCRSSKRWAESRGKLEGDNYARSLVRPTGSGGRSPGLRRTAHAQRRPRRGAGEAGGFRRQSVGHLSTAWPAHYGIPKGHHQQRRCRGHRSGRPWSGSTPARQRVWLYNGQRNGRWMGTAAEYIALSVDLVTELPDHVSFAEGATLGVPAMTAHRAVFVAGPVQGKIVLVTGGAGAVGHYAVQLATWAGATVIATVRSSD